MQAGGQRAGKRIHFKYEDVQAIRDEAPLVRLVSAEWDDPVAYKYGDRVISVQTKAIHREMRKLNLGEGRYFEESPNIARVRGTLDPCGRGFKTRTTTKTSQRGTDPGWE